MNKRSTKNFKYACLEGYSWNPLRKYPRNAECFCKSGLKFKKCCMSKLSPVVRSNQVAEIEKALATNQKIMIRPPTLDEIEKHAQGLM